MATDEQLPIKVDVKADTKDAANVIEKLIDTIKAPFSWWAKTREPVTEAKAEVDATLIRARAIEPLAKALGITKDEAISLVLRSEQREVFDRIRQQKNIESIVQGAIELVPSAASPQPVDEDWTTDFLDSCKNISNEEMQTLWSRILAGEVAEPGSFSKRTIAFVKTLSVSDAHLFTRFCNFLWYAPQEKTYYHVRTPDDEIISKAGLTFREILELDTLGIIVFDNDTRFVFDAVSEVPEFNYFGESYYLYPKAKEGSILLKALSLTKLGESLAPIAGAKPNEKYKNAAIESIADQNIVLDHRPPKQ